MNVTELNFFDMDDENFDFLAYEPYVLPPALYENPLFNKPEDKKEPMECDNPGKVSLKENFDNECLDFEPDDNANTIDDNANTIDDNASTIDDNASTIDDNASTMDDDSDNTSTADDNSDNESVADDDPTEPANEPTNEPTKSANEPTKFANEPTEPANELANEPAKSANEPTEPANELANEPTTNEPTKPEPTKSTNEPTEPANEPTEPANERVIFANQPKIYDNRTNSYPQVVYHDTSAVAVLAVGSDGFTISNGRTSISRDCVDFSTLASDISTLHFKNLRLVDSKSQEVWNKYKNSRMRLISEKILDGKLNSSNCKFCHRSECHRWKATVYGMEKLIWSSIVPNIVHPFYRSEKQVTQHLVTAAISITNKGFTISDGILSVCHDGQHTNSFIGASIRRFRVRKLFAVDNFTLAKCKEITRNGALSQIYLQMLGPHNAGRCIFCMEKNCHRWLATRGGIGRIIKFNIEPIVHYL